MKPRLTERSERKSVAECDPTPSEGMYCVYVLKNRGTQRLYYGYTNNLDRRLAEHRHHDRQELVYYEAYKTGADARRRELQLKHHAQALTALKVRLRESIQ